MKHATIIKAKIETIVPLDIIYDFYMRSYKINVVAGRLVIVESNDIYITINKIFYYRLGEEKPLFNKGQVIVITKYELKEGKMHILDYFNYGENEESFKDKRRKCRQELENELKEKILKRYKSISSYLDKKEKRINELRLEREARLKSEEIEKIKRMDKLKEEFIKCKTDETLMILEADREPYFNVHFEEWRCSFNIIYYRENILKSNYYKKYSFHPFEYGRAIFGLKEPPRFIKYDIVFVNKIKDGYIKDYFVKHIKKITEDIMQHEYTKEKESKVINRLKNESLINRFIEIIRPIVNRNYDSKYIEKINSDWIKLDYKDSPSGYQGSTTLTKDELLNVQKNKDYFSDVKIGTINESKDWKGNKEYKVEYIFDTYCQSFFFKCICGNKIKYSVYKRYNLKEQYYTLSYSPWGYGSVFCPNCSLYLISEMTKKVNNSFLGITNEFNTIDKNELYKEFSYIRRDRVNVIRQNLGLPSLDKIHSSIGEITLRKILKNIYPDEEILYNSTKEIGMELDIYIPNLRIAFEYQGRQHLEFIKHFHKNKQDLKNQMKIDKKKKDLCKKKDIKLLIINYFDPLNMDFIKSKIKE